MAAPGSVDKSRLRQVLIDRFSLDELKEVAFDLGVDPELLRHETIPLFSRELIAYFERRGQLRHLLTEILRRRDDEYLTEMLDKLDRDAPQATGDTPLVPRSNPSERLEQSNTGPQIDNPTHLDLSPEEEGVLKVMFAAYRRVTIENEFHPGFSGSRVFLVRPIRGEHSPDLRAVAKVGPVGLIRKELQAYQEHVHLRLPSVAEITGGPVLPPDNPLGGLRYTLMGEGDAFKVVSLRSYYHDVSISDIRHVLGERLFKVLGPPCWLFSEARAAWPVQASYDSLLPVNLLIEPAVPPPGIAVPTLRPNVVPGPSLVAGDYVRLEGFIVTEVDPKKKSVTLNVPPRKDGLPASYRLRLEQVESVEPYRVDDEIASIEGRIKRTRNDQLRDSVLDALEHRFDLTANTLTAPDGTTLPNPLMALATLMGRTRDVRVSCIHGDLNMENVLVEPVGHRVSLIDFATVRRDHTLHDLLRLETEVVAKLLPEVLSEAKLLVKTIETFYKRLHKVTFDPKQSVSTRPYEADLEKPFEMLVAIREMARQCLFDPNDWTEYYEGLTLYTLGALKFKNLDRLSKEVAFWTAATAYNFVEPVPVRGRSTAKDWTRLQKYLPAEMYQAREDATCLDHLNALLRAVLAYLPRHLAFDLLRKPVVAQNTGQFLEGTLLFADISHFTELAEELRKKGGEEGAEELVRVINEYLEVMLAVLFKRGGHLVKFGGDGMLCLFTGTDRDAMNAVWAAWEMRQAVKDHFAEVVLLQEVYPLEMKVGGNSGLLFTATVGTEKHMEYVLTGSALERTAQAESVADKGDILISSETHALIKEHLEAKELADQPGFFRVIDIPTKPVPEIQDPWNEIEEYLSIIQDDLWEVVDRLDALSPYLPAGVLPQLVYDPQGGEIEGQHRQMTILFSNFTGMRDVIHARGVKDEAGIAADLSEYFRIMQEEVEYYGGVVNKVDLYDQGDKLMVLFGAPMAHERDVERAALTALAMQDAIGRLRSPIASTLLVQHIGIHTGFAFSGNVGALHHNRCEYTVMGDTVNLAARLMSAAESNQVLVSERLWDQIEAGFEAQVVPPVRLKGVSEPVAARWLLRFQGVQTRTRPRVFHSEMVGRRDKLEILEKCFHDLSLGGWKQVIAITGPAGVGKTRLVAEWKEQTVGSGVTWLSARGHPYGQKRQGVFIEILERLLNIADDDSQVERWRKLAARVKATFSDGGPAFAEELSNRLAYLGKFLALDLAMRQGLAERVDALDPEPLQLQIRLAFCALLTHAASGQPLILVLEDLHLADADSLDMLKFVVDRVSDDAPLLFCLIFRPRKELAVWSTWEAIRQSCPDCASIELQELGEADIRQLLSNLLAASELPEIFQTRVLDAADGNPLYVEEILRTLIEEGAIVRGEAGWQIERDIEYIRLPDTLRQIIQSRIDELDFGSPGARRVLWMASVIGEEFAQDLLQDLFVGTGRKVEEFWRHLRELRNAAMITRVRIDKDATSTPESQQPRYRFRHGLVQQVAYQNMLVARRREYHAEVGRWLEKKHDEHLQRHFNTLAYHYDQGQDWAKAFQYHWLAGRDDAQVYANQSAISHLRRALEIASSKDQGARDLGRVHLELGKVLVVTGDFDDALGRLSEAWELLEGVPGQAAASQRARVGYEIGRIHQRRGDLPAALQWQVKGLELLPETPTAEAALLHLLGAAVGVHQADYDRVDRECKQALDLARATGAMSALALAHRLSGISARARGCLDLAMVHCRRSISICTGLFDQVGLAKDYANRGLYAFEIGDWQLAEMPYLQALEIQEKTGDKFQAAYTKANLGDLHCHLGNLEQGFAYARPSLKTSTELEACHGIIIAHAVLATLFWRAGDFEQARAHLLEAREVIREAELPEFGPTVGRWLAQVYLTEGNVSQARVELEPWCSLPVKNLDVEFEPIQCLWGRILAAQEKPVEALQVLKASLERLERKTMRYHTARALLALADVLADGPGKAGEARAHAECARAMFTRMGAEPDMQEVDRLIAERLAASGQLAETVQMLEANLEQLEQAQMREQITESADAPGGRPKERRLRQKLEQRRVRYHVAIARSALARVLAGIEGRDLEAEAHAERAREISADLDADWTQMIDELAAELDGVGG